MIKVKNEEVHNLELSRPFKGFNVAGVLRKNDGTEITGIEALLSKMDLTKVQVSLRNLVTGITCWDFNLFDFLTILSWKDRDLTEVVRQEGRIAWNSYGGNFALARNLSLFFDTYDGNYQFTIETKSGAFPTGYENNSYMSIITDWSTSPMVYETRYDDFSLDKANFDQELGNGVEEVIIFTNTGDEEAFTGFDSKVIDTATILSSEISEKYNTIDLAVMTAQLKENNAWSTGYVLALHDGEILSNVRVSLQLLNPDKSIRLAFKKLYANPNGEMSLSKQEARVEASLGMIPRMSN